VKRTAPLRVAVRFGCATPAAPEFPRMLRIRHDKPLHEADTLQSLLALAGGE
jgi:hypothetical protein